MNQSNWETDTAPVQVIRYFKLQKSAYAVNINEQVIKSIPSAKELVETPLKSIWSSSNGH